MKKLSILIPTTLRRQADLAHLLSILNPQLTDEVELIIDPTEYISIGRKRSLMLKNATGKFIVFIDDDDDIASNYVSLILAAIDSDEQADCVGIQGIMTTDGTNQRQWYISKEFGGWYEKDMIYYRCQNHISPVLREHALKADFDDMTSREDYLYSMRLLPLLRKEVIIPVNIYHYKFISYQLRK